MQFIEIIALLAGAVAGALLRVLVERVTQSMNTPRVWAAECVAGLMLGATLGLAFIKLEGEHNPAISSLGGALTAYCGACTAYQLFAHKSGTRKPLSALAHFGSATIATTLGFAGILGILATSK